MLSLSTVYANFDNIQAYAGETLDNDNVAKTIQVRINPTEQIRNSYLIHFQE